MNDNLIRYKNKLFHVESIALILAFTCITCLFSCTLKTGTKTAEEMEHEMVLKHKVKIIKVYQTDFRIGMALPEFLSQVRTYNEAGLRTTELNYNDSISIHSLIHCEYDKNGNLISTISRGPEGGLIFREIRKYNNQNKRTELIFYLPDGTYKYRNVSTYNSDGNLGQLAWYWPEGLRAINKYVYNRGLKVEDTEYNPENKRNYKWIYNYDKRGNQTEAIQYYPDSIINAKTIYNYDQDNRLTKQIDFSGLSVRKQTFFTYYSNGLTDIKTEVSPVGSVQSKYRYEYEFYK